MNNMKILESLEAMTDPMRSKAINNYNNNPDKCILEDREVEKISHALGNAFNWRESPEGQYYWSEYHNTLLSLGL